MGNVCPPSVLKEIFTFTTLIGARSVEPTLQVTFCVVPTPQETAVFGAVTANGPLVPLTVITTSAKEVCPTSGESVLELNGALSLTVSLKLSVLATELSASIFAPASPPGNGPVTFWPAKIVES